MLSASFFLTSSDGRIINSSDIWALRKMKALCENRWFRVLGKWILSLDSVSRKSTHLHFRCVTRSHRHGLWGCSWCLQSFAFFWVWDAKHHSIIGIAEVWRCHLRTHYAWAKSCQVCISVKLRNIREKSTLSTSSQSWPSFPHHLSLDLYLVQPSLELCLVCFKPLSLSLL